MNMSYIIEVDISNQRDETKMAQYCRTIQNDTPFSIDDFKIIDMERSSFSLRILESLHIFKTKPSLNDKTSAFKLNIVT